MKLHRLLEMVCILLQKKTITAKDLAEHFEVSERTIYRDIETLSMADIPVYTTKGKGGGIGIMNQYVLDKSLLSEQEQLHILASIQAMNVLQFSDTKRVLDKLSGMFQKANTEWIDVDFSYWGSPSIENEKMNQVKTAILNQSVIQFDYYSSKGEIANRMVEPDKLFFKEKNWYISGFCRLRQECRTFKIRRIKNLNITHETFYRDNHQKISSSSDDYSRQMVFLTLKVDEKLSYRLYDEFQPNSITKNDDGSFTIDVMLPEDEWLYGYIMSYGYYAQVMEPQHIRTMIRSMLEKSLNMYL